MSVKISELPILDSLADNDVIAGVDTSANVTSKIEMATLKNYIDTNTQYTAGTNIDITNNVVSAPNVYNKTETDELLEEKDEQIEELQSEIDSLSTIFNAFPTESGEGESLTLDDTAEVKFKKFDLKGNTSQTTYSGKNLLENNLQSQTANGITFTRNDDGSLTFSGTATQAHSITGRFTKELTLKKGVTYTFSIGDKQAGYGIYLQYLDNVNIYYLGVSATNSSLTFTPDEDKKIDRLAIHFPNGNTVNGTIYPMLEVGSSSTSYEPYVGGTASPNPSYPQPINVVSGDNTIDICGKNLFNKDSVSIGYLKEDGTLSTDTAYRTSAFMPIRPNTTYYKTSTGSPRTKYFDINKVPLNTTTYWDVPTGGSAGTFTTPNNAYYLRFSFPFTGSSAIDAGTIMVKEGTDTTYEPYQGNTYNIDLPVENLFDKDSATLNVGINTSNGNTYNDSNLFSSDYIPISINTPYVANSASTTGNRVFGACYDSNKVYLGAVSTGVGERKFTVTITNAKYVRITGQKVNIDTYQIEEGTKIHSYSPFGTTPIELCKIGTYQDYIYKDSDKWYLHKEIGKVVLNGGENISIYNQNTNRTNFQIDILTGIENYLGNYDVPNLLSNMFNVVSQSATWAVGNISRRKEAQTTLYLTYEPSTTIDQFKTWLSTHNVNVYYIFATPTTTEITYQPLIDQLNELEKAMSKDSQTNISQVNNDLGFIIYAEAIKSLENVLDRIELLES